MYLNPSFSRYHIVQREDNSPSTPSDPPSSSEQFIQWKKIILATRLYTQVMNIFTLRSDIWINLDSQHDLVYFFVAFYKRLIFNQLLKFLFLLNRRGLFWFLDCNLHFVAVSPSNIVPSSSRRQLPLFSLYFFKHVYCPIVIATRASLVLAIASSTVLLYEQIYYYLLNTVHIWNLYVAVVSNQREYTSDIHNPKVLFIIYRRIFHHFDSLIVICIKRTTSFFHICNPISFYTMRFSSRWPLLLWIRHRY